MERTVKRYETEALCRRSCDGCSEHLHHLSITALIIKLTTKDATQKKKLNSHHKS